MMTENEFIIKSMPVILGMFSDIDDRILAVPEVPRSWKSHNDSMDALLIWEKKRKFIAIEFKIADTGKLKEQIADNVHKTGISTIGIIPGNAKEYRIFSLDTDMQTERLSAFFCNRNNWTDIHPGNNGLAYWYAYRDHETDFDSAGLGFGGKREGFADMYKRAMCSLMGEVAVNGLNPMVMSHCLRGYSAGSIGRFMNEIKGKRCTQE